MLLGDYEASIKFPAQIPQSVQSGIYFYSSVSRVTDLLCKLLVETPIPSNLKTNEVHCCLWF